MVASAACKSHLASVNLEMMDSTMIPIQGTISQYVPHAMRDHFDDGSFASFALSEILIAAQVEGVPDKLKIYHDESVEVPACWQGIGKTVAFSIAKEDLKMSKIFRDALEDVVCE